MKRFQVKFPSDVHYMKAKVEFEKLGLVFKDAKSSSEKKQFNNSQSQSNNSQELSLMNNAYNKSSAQQPNLLLQPSYIPMTQTATTAVNNSTNYVNPAPLQHVMPNAEIFSNTPPLKRFRGDAGMTQMPLRSDTSIESITASQQPTWDENVVITSSPFNPNRNAYSYGANSQYPIIAATPLNSQTQASWVAQPENQAYANLIPSPPTTSQILPTELTEEEKQLRSKVLFYLKQDSFIQLCQSLERVWNKM